MATKSNTTMDAQACRQLIMKADADLAAYQAHIAQAEKAIDLATSELDSIASRGDGRVQALQLAQQTVQHLKAELEQARTRATLAQGTLADTGEASVKSLEKRLQKAERDLASLSTRLSKEETADQERARSAQANRERSEKNLDYFQRQQETLSRVKEQAYQDLGECEHQEVLARLQYLQRELADKELEVTAALAALDDFTGEAKEHLADWPDLLEQVKPHLAYRDDVTAALESALHFVSVCLAQGRGTANIDSAVFRGIPWSDMFSLLAFEQSDYHGFLRGSADPEILQDRKRALEKVLAVYREMKR